MTSATTSTTTTTPTHTCTPPPPPHTHAPAPPLRAPPELESALPAPPRRACRQAHCWTTLAATSTRCAWCPRSRPTSTWTTCGAGWSRSSPTFARRRVVGVVALAVWVEVVGAAGVPGSVGRRQPGAAGSGCSGSQGDVGCFSPKLLTRFPRQLGNLRQKVVAVGILLNRRPHLVPCRAAAAACR